jgi:sulfur carrier protein ThiS adenylyltransferase
LFRTGSEAVPIADRWRPAHGTATACFACIDSIAVREALWRTARRSTPFWCDGRMLGETVRVLTVADGTGRDHYPTTLFAPAEAQPGRCTARSTLYAASLAASLMLHQFTRWLRRVPVDPDLTFNLLASELTLAETSPIPQDPLHLPRETP